MMGGTTLLIVLAALSASSFATYYVGQSGTRGGNSPGRACVFPFIYKSQSYDVCITLDNRFKPWCSTTPNYDNNGQWANCKITIKAVRSRRGNSGRSSCVLPFIYKGQTYENCTVEDNPINRPWCATSPNYNRDKRWALCVRYPDIKTTGGNVPEGTACNFPFWYNGQRFHGCIATNNDGVGWCSTTLNYNNQGLWGNCVVTTMKSADSACPNGNTYTSQAQTLSFGGTGKPDANTVEACQAECDKESACVGFDYDTNPGVSPKCFIHTNAANFNQKETTDVVSVTQYTLTNRCTNQPTSGGDEETETGKPVITKGGNAGPEGRCVFPFRYKGHLHMSCCSQDWYTPWCGTTDNYDRDRNFGDCFNIPTQ